MIFKFCGLLQIINIIFPIAILTLQKGSLSISSFFLIFVALLKRLQFSFTRSKLFLKVAILTFRIFSKSINHSHSRSNRHNFFKMHKLFLAIFDRLFLLYHFYIFLHYHQVSLISIIFLHFTLSLYHFTFFNIFLLLILQSHFHLIFCFYHYYFISLLMFLKFKQKMTIEECDEFKTLFKNLLHLIKQRNKLFGGVGAILHQDSALLHLLKQVLLGDKENSHPLFSTSTSSFIQSFTSTLSDKRSLPATELCIPILPAKPKSTYFLLSPQLLSPFSSSPPSPSTSISNSTSALTSNSNSFSILLSISTSTFSFVTSSPYLRKVNCFSLSPFVNCILFYLFYIFLTFDLGNLHFAFFVFPTDFSFIAICNHQCLGGNTHI